MTLYTASSRIILLVDDNADAAEALGELLSTLGHDVRLAHDGPSALSLAREILPEVVILDIGLPGMDGYEVARRLRGECELENAMLIALTGYAQESDRRLSREAGFHHHFSKPLDIATLNAAINGLDG